MWKKHMLWMFLLICILMIAACSNNDSSNGGDVASSPSNDSNDEQNTNEGSSTDEEELEQVNLIWYYYGREQDDIQAVQDAVNEITLEKINATVELRAESPYQDKMNPIVASGEEFDLAWTSNWHFDYVQNVHRGAFLPLDDLIDEYAPELYDILPPVAFDSAIVDGELYAIPNYQTFANQAGFLLRRRVLEAYPLDIDRIQTLSDMTPYMQTLKDADLTPLFAEWREEQGKPTAGIETYVVGRTDFSHFIFHYGLEEAGTKVAAIYHDDEDLQVVNVYETPEYAEHLEVVNEWYDKGFIHPDVAIEVPDTVDHAMTTYNVLMPGNDERVLYLKNTAWDSVQYVPVSEAYVPNGGPIRTATAISRTSENPERAMMLLRLVNTDKELFNLLSYGIEGKHYEKIDEQYIKPIPDSGYGPGMNWVFGNTFNEYLREGLPSTMHEEILEQNENAVPSAIMGFVFNPDPVQTEIANITSIIGEYALGLETGTLDKDEYLPEFQNRLSNAGADRVVAEVQKQLDEWKANK